MARYLSRYPIREGHAALTFQEIFRRACWRNPEGLRPKDRVGVTLHTNSHHQTCKPQAQSRDDRERQQYARNRQRQVIAT
jgi:hypothetical protein